MDVMDAIRSRRSIRKYSDRPIEEEKLRTVLEAARLAPSAQNKQQWKFILVRDPKLIEQLVPACGGQKFVGEAPAIVVACALSHYTMACGQDTDSIDLSIGLSFLVLEAWEQGLGTCWLGYFYEDQVKRILQIPDDVRVIAVSPLGYPEESPQPRPRKSFEETISFDTF